MDADRFSLIETVFHRVSPLAGAERERALAEACEGDEDLRREVEELLAAADRTAAAIDRPASGPPRELDLEDPRRIGPYPVLRRLGQGGSSVVYLALEEGEGFSRQVAVKVLTGFLGEPVLRRFASETSILAGLEHAGIARFHTAGRAEDGTAYLVLEYVEGTDLLSYCRERGAPLGERLRLFGSVLDAVDFAHRRLVVHRDLKPSNVLVSKDGTPKLLDFGIAALLDPAEGWAGGETATWLRALTPAYASPEQLRGERVTVATDVYSLGVMLYELLAGVRPFAGSTLSDELARGFKGGEPEPPSAAARRAGGGVAAGLLEGDLDAIVLKALRHDPADRYASVAALGEDLRRYGAGLPVSARRSTARYRAALFLRRHALAAAALAGFVALAVGGVFWHVTRLQRERDRARDAAVEARREADRSQRMVDLLTAIFDSASPLNQPGRPLTSVELLERGSERINQDLTLEPELRAQLRSVLAGIWLSLGDKDRAAALAEPAAVELERLLGPDHATTAQAWSTLGSLRYQQGRYPEARKLFERALAVQRARLGTNPFVALTLARYAASLMVLGEDGAARAALLEALAITRKVKGPESTAEGRYLNDLSAVQQRLEDWNGAGQSAERAAVILAKRLGEASPGYATALSNLAQVRLNQGRAAEAADLEARVIRTNQKVFGGSGSYPREYIHRNMLGWMYLDLKRYDEARHEFELSLAASAHENGPTSASNAYPMNGLASVDLATGRLDRARRQAEEALALREKAYGPKHVDVARSLDDVAEIAGKQEDYTAEEACLRRGLAICRESYEADHPELARATSRLGGALCRKRGSEEGRKLLAEAIRLREKAAGAQDKDLPAWRKALADCG